MNNHLWGNGNIIGTYQSCIIFLLLILALTPSAIAADTMFRANAEHTGVFDNGGIVTTNTELWRFTTGDYVRSSPSVSNGVVYIGSMDGNLYAVGVPSNQVNKPNDVSTQTTIPTQSVSTNISATTTVASPPIWDRNNLIYLVLLVFVFL